MHFLGCGGKLQLRGGVSMSDVKLNFCKQGHGTLRGRSPGWGMGQGQLSGSRSHSFFVCSMVNLIELLVLISCAAVDR